VGRGVYERPHVVVENIEPFGSTLLLTASVVTIALVSNRISALLRLPAPVLFLVAGAAASGLVPTLSKGSIVTVQQVVTVALVLILFDGGAGIGVRKLRTALAPVLTLGVLRVALGGEAGDVGADLGLQRFGQHPPGALAHDLVDQRPRRAGGRPRGVVLVAVGLLGNYGEHGSYLPDRRWRADLA
jgi:hypothetical protein